MVNLIPPSAKKSVTIEYWMRVLTVWALIVTVVAILFSLTFMPVYVLVDTKIDAYQESAELASQKIASFEAVSVDLRRSTEQAQLILASTNETDLSSVIELFDSLETGGIMLDQILVSKAAGGALAPVTLSGNARDRQALADFRDRLLAQEAVQAVDFPISNLAKDRDISFSMTITMSNEVSL